MKTLNIAKANCERVKWYRNNYEFFDITISLSWKRGKKQKGIVWFQETPILEVIFVALTENSSLVTNDSEGPQEYPHTEI